MKRSRPSRLDSREPKWWDTLSELVEKYGLPEPAMDDFMSLVLDAIDEDGAVTAASRGGKKGAVARAAAMTAEERSQSASKAAKARWRGKRL